MTARTFTLEPQAIVTQPAHALTLGAIAIRQRNGLYCLNDVHKASGGAEKHRPVEYLRLDSTQALIEELIHIHATNSTDMQSKESVKEVGHARLACEVNYEVGGQQQEPAEPK